MNLISQDLLYFLKVSEGLTLEQASRDLGVTQPALSRALSRLEGDLGQKLFSRQRRQLHLSTAGSELRSRALVWKSLMENDLNSIDKTGRPETVVLRLGFHSSIGSDFVAPVLKALQKSFPQLVLHFHLAKSPEIQSALLRRQLEIGVVVNAVPKAQLIVRRLGRIQSFFYGKLRNGGQLFINPNMVDVQKYLRRLQPQLNVKEVLIPDYDFMAALVKNDVGAALLPEHIARRFHLRPAEVETITAVEFDLSLVYLAEDLSPSQKSVARSFEELLKAQMS